MIAKKMWHHLFFSQKRNCMPEDRHRYHVMGTSILNIFYICEKDNDSDPAMPIKYNDTIYGNIVCSTVWKFQDILYIKNRRKINYLFIFCFISLLSK